ncbi:MAG: ATP-binding cassette domain-containing protein, partial [Eggerthella sp.]|nr:ATP-binding cassette domain-containing protein [Eggerthella sp.]
MSLFQAEDIAVSYLRAGVRTTLLSGASFSLEAGGVYDLVGPSGSGKSTLLRVCARMLARDGGELFLDGAPSSSFEPVQWRRRVCLVPQQPALVGGTVRDN